jgi:hypothetical protein
MSSLKQAAQQFVSDYENGDLGDLKHYARALRAALAQQEQEPVAWMVTTTDERHFIFRMNKPAIGEGETLTPLYTHPLRREWQSLSGEEVKTAIGASEDFWAKSSLWITSIARAVEAKLKESNHV